MLIIHIQTLLKLKVNLPYHDLLFDCEMSGKHSFQCMNNSKKERHACF